MITEKEVKKLHKMIDTEKIKQPDAVGKVFNNGVEMARKQVEAWLIEVINNN